MQNVARHTRHCQRPRLYTLSPVSPETRADFEAPAVFPAGLCLNTGSSRPWPPVAGRLLPRSARRQIRAGESLP